MLKKIIIISEDVDHIGHFEWREVYNGDTLSEEEAIQKYMEEFESDEREYIEAHTVDISKL